MSGVLCDRKVPLSVKGKLHKVVVRPAMLYSTETLAVTQRMKKKLEVAEMRMLRFERGNTRLDKVKNEEVRSKFEGGTTGGGGKDERRKVKVVWSCDETREKVLGKESYVNGSGEEEERKTKEKVEGLHKRRPESCGTGRSRRARPKKVKKMRPHRRPHLSRS